MSDSNLEEKVLGLIRQRGRLMSVTDVWNALCSTSAAVQHSEVKKVMDKLTGDNNLLEKPPASGSGQPRYKAA